MKTRISPLLKPLLLFTAMFAAMGGPSLAPALPAIKEAYHEIPDIEFWTKWLVSISGLFAAMGAPLFGWLSDKWDRRKALILGLGMWGVFGSSGMFEQPFWSLLAARAALGLSLGGLLAANSALIADSFKAVERRRMMGAQSTSTSAGVILSLVVSGFLADIHWHWAFSIYLLALAVLPLALHTSVPTAKPHEQDKSKKASPLSGSFLLVCFFAILGMAAFNIIPTQIPFFLQQEHYFASTHMGLVLTILPITSGITGRLYAYISQHFKLWNMFVLSGTLMFLGFGLVSVSTTPLMIILGLGLVGMGTGSAMPHVNVIISTIVPGRAVGRALGILAGCKFFGLFASPLIMQPALTQWDYRGMFCFGGALLLLAALFLAIVGPVMLARDVSAGRCVPEQPDHGINQNTPGEA